MPRNGSGVYSHPFPDVVEGTTIESAVFNGNTSDVEQDLNTPRPIVAGGTGANNAHDAMIALSGEIAQQGPVTNYDSFPFVAGSFYSLAGATAAPNPTNRFSGICIALNDGTGDLRLEVARGDGTMPYYRVKNSGVWGAWIQRPGAAADLDAAYVNVAGDTMTGSLTVNGKVDVYANANTPSQNGLSIGAAQKAVAPSAGQGSIQFYSNDPAVTNLGASIQLITDPVPANRRLQIQSLEQGIAWRNVTLCEAAGNVGIGTAVPQAPLHVHTGANENLWVRDVSSTLDLSALNDAGNALVPMRISATMLTAVGGITSQTGGGGSGHYYFGNTGAKYLTHDSANFNFVGGNVLAPALLANSNIHAGYANAAVGFYYFGNNGTKYLACDGTNFAFSAGNFTANGAIVANGAGITAGGATSDIVAGRNVIAGAGGLVMNNAGSVYFRYGAGVGGEPMDYVYNNTVWTRWRGTDGAMIHSYNAFKPGGGVWGDSSDSRIKNVEGEYTRGLAEIVALRPVHYTFKGNDTGEAPAYIKNADGEIPAEMAKTPLAVPYPNSAHRIAAENATKYAGLIAQEVELVFPEMVTKRSAYIDGVAVDDLRDLDTTPLIFALINSCKELAARVEALEAQLAAR